MASSIRLVESADKEASSEEVIQMVKDVCDPFIAQFSKAGHQRPHRGRSIDCAFQDAQDRSPPWAWEEWRDLSLYGEILKGR